MEKHLLEQHVETTTGGWDLYVFVEVFFLMMRLESRRRNDAVGGQ